MKFEEAIKSIRKQAFLSQESFSKEIGVSFSTVNRWEKGKAKPSYNAMQKITHFCEKHALVLDIDPNE